MNRDIIVIDHFYEDPLGIRDYALTKDFTIKGTYPGFRSPIEPRGQWLNLRSAMEEILREEITHWPMDYNTGFQVTFEEDTTWVHHDLSRWAGVLFLTPNAPNEAGTSFWRHKDTGIDRWLPDDPRTELHELCIGDDKDLDKWEMHGFVGNKFNRLVLFDGRMYHRSHFPPGLGKDKYTARLIQNFFFDTAES